MYEFKKHNNLLTFNYINFQFVMTIVQLFEKLLGEHEERETHRHSTLVYCSVRFISPFGNRDPFLGTLVIVDILIMLREGLVVVN
jgi:hypothetical protein